MRAEEKEGCGICFIEARSVEDNCIWPCVPMYGIVSELLVVARMHKRNIMLMVNVEVT